MGFDSRVICTIPHLYADNTTIEMHVSSFLLTPSLGVLHAEAAAMLPHAFDLGQGARRQRGRAVGAFLAAVPGLIMLPVESIFNGTRLNAGQLFPVS